MTNRKRKRGWHFRKEFVAGCIIIVLLTIAIFVASAFKTAQRKQTKTPAPLDNSVSHTEEEKTTLPPQTVPVASIANPTVSDDDKVIYLTFDDGPTANTKNILDVLDRYGIKATFFVIHTYDGCEAQIKEIYDRGQQLALHSYTHDYSIYRSMDTYFDDLNKISDLVYNATGYRSMLVRFPGGTSNTISRDYCDGIMSALAEELPRRGYQYFDWDWDSTDASGNRRDVDVIVDNATDAIDYGDNHVILLMHDAAAKTTTVEALPQIIEAYRDAGYRFDVLSLTSYTYHHNPNN